MSTPSERIKLDLSSSTRRADEGADTRSRELTRLLVRRVVDRVYPPGTRLPTERELAAEFGVARHVVREALKRMEALGMVRIRQGSGIHVEDLQITGGLELFHSMLTREDGTFDLEFLRDALAFRQEMVDKVIRLCARNRSAAQLEEMRRLVAERREALGEHERVTRINQDLFRLVARATNNRLYELIFNTIGQVYLRLRRAVTVPPDDRVRYQEMLEHLLDAVEHRDEEMAELLLARYQSALDKTLQNALAVISATDRPISEQ